jgi:hypothetical protein
MSGAHAACAAPAHAPKFFPENKSALQLHFTDDPRIALAHALPFHRVAMRLSEAITIYLAAGAPFGVTSFLHERPDRRRALALLEAAGAMLLWPLAASAILFARQRHKDDTAHANGKPFGVPIGERVEQAQRDLLASVYKVYEMAQDSFGKDREKMERAACKIREIVEKYAGLARVRVEINSDAMPDRREMELCRVAGRKGDDLLLAGLCIRRRNVARINAHVDRARTELVHALAELREQVDVTRLSSHTSTQPLRLLSEAILESYGRAIEMFSLLDDQRAAMSIARLLDVECARLRRLEAAIVGDAREECAFGEEQCIPHAPHTFSTGLSQRSNLSQG